MVRWVDGMVRWVDGKEGRRVDGKVGVWWVDGKMSRR